MKNFSDIQSLLDRYWDGESTLEEERALKAYFASGQVDERLRAIAPIFQALREEQAIRYAQPEISHLKPVLFTWKKLAAAASFALLLNAGLWWGMHRETPVTETVALLPHTSPEISVPQEQPDLEEIKTAIAAAEKPAETTRKTQVRHKKCQNTKPLDSETKQAMEEIKAALALVSSKIRKGKQEAAKGAIYLENVDKVIKKKLEG